ncbi:MAG: hypothetical protein HKN78_04580, partial [Sphingomonadaceae bacterium]|nr:hypothetical protein [Sphingomonadaceae bacterium]
TVMRLDTEEPAAASFGVAVVFPDGNGDLGPVGLACWLNWGFGFVDVAATQSAYDPAQGLTLTIPTGRYDPETGGTRPGAPIRWLINLAQGSITDLDAHDGHDH